MIIEVDDDCVDGIIQTALVRDYIYLTDDLKRYKKDPNSLHEEDAVAYAETVKGIEILGNWYFPWGEFDKAIKKARKAK